MKIICFDKHVISVYILLRKHENSAIIISDILDKNNDEYNLCVESKIIYSVSFFFLVINFTLIFNLFEYLLIIFI